MQDPIEYGEESWQLRNMQDELTLIPANMAAAHADATIASSIAVDGVDRFRAHIQGLACKMHMLVEAIARVINTEQARQHL